MPCKNNIPCKPKSTSYKLKSGKLCCRKKRKTTKKVVSKKTEKSNFSLSDAKKKLKVSFSVNVNGKIKSPPFISTMEQVTGRNSLEKIANLRRVLSSCKKMGVSLVKKNGTFKKYKTLIRDCGVKFTKTPGVIGLSNLLAKRRALMVPKAASLSNMVPESSLSDVGSYVPPEYFPL
jgi:hypothetical protein